MSILRRVFPTSAQSVCTLIVLYLNKVKYTTKMSKKTALLLIADGSEEMEAVITTDVLRRVGVSVFIVYNLKCIFTLHFLVKFY